MGYDLELAERVRTLLADPERTAELAESTPAVLAEMRGQVMKSWLRIASSELDGRAQLRTWVDLALAHT